MLDDFERRPDAPPISPLERARAISPWLTGIVLLAVLVTGVVERPAPVDTAAYFAAVAQRVRDVPYTVADWVGRDAEVVPATQEILKPNAIVQRRYARLTDSAWFDLIVVHCGDVRTMQGHYPPVCYPAAGWSIDQGTPTTVAIGALGAPATEYVVTWPFDRGVSPMRIVNFFVLPGDGVQYARDMRALSAAARAKSSAELGVLQIQVLTPVAMDEDGRAEVLKGVWAALEPVVREVVGGPDANR